MLPEQSFQNRRVLVQLYFDGDERFRTTGAGVSVTGTVDTDDLTTDNINITGKVTTKDLGVTGIATVDNIQIYWAYLKAHKRHSPGNG